MRTLDHPTFSKVVGANRGPDGAIRFARDGTTYSLIVSKESWKSLHYIIDSSTFYSIYLVGVYTAALRVRVTCRLRLIMLLIGINRDL